MKTIKEQIFELINLHFSANENGVSTQYIADALRIKRSNASKLLNELITEGKIEKSTGRPVLYKAKVDKARKPQSFDKLVGIDGSLRRCERLIEAAVMYPVKSMDLHITGQRGTGKSLLASLEYQYAIECGVLKRDAPFIVFDAQPYAGDEEKADGGLQKATQSAKGGVLAIDNAHRLPAQLRVNLCEAAEAGKLGAQLVVITDMSYTEAAEDMRNRLPITIELPTLAQRPMSERLELVQRFLSLEAVRAGRAIQVSAEVLFCLLLYDLKYNIAQLKADIKAACACAYVRAVSSDADSFEIYKGDFENYVRKGLMNYGAHRQELERLVNPLCKYTYGSDTVKISPTEREKLLYSSNLYKDLNKKSAELRSWGIEETKIPVLLEAEIEANFNAYKISLARAVPNMEQLSKIADKTVIDMTQEFLTEASTRLFKAYPDNTYYGLCLHIDSLVKGRRTARGLAAAQVASILEKNREEYTLALRFAARLEEVFGLDKLPVDEVAFIAMFIAPEADHEKAIAKPALMFAMKNGAACALAAYVSEESGGKKAFAVDIPPKKSSDEIYRLLLENIDKSDSGAGLVVMCGGEEIYRILTEIQAETAKNIRVIDMHMDVFAKKLAGFMDSCDSTDALCEKVIDAVKIGEVQRRHAIAVLCTTGKGGAEQMRRYIEQHGNVGDTAVIPLAATDKELLKEQLAEIMQNAAIDCVIGVRDPKLFSLPFIPLGDVLSSPQDKLPALLKYGANEKWRVNYDDVYASFSGWLEYADIKKLKRFLPIVMDGIKTKVSPLSIDSETGLFIHLACCINRLCAKEMVKPNPHKDEIFEGYPKQVKTLLTILAPVEKSFGIVFNDDELANMLTIIYQL